MGDDVTRRFMTRFYSNLFQGRDLAFAFHEAQLAQLRELKAERGLEWAVFGAGGLVLTR